MWETVFCFDTCLAVGGLRLLLLVLPLMNVLPLLLQPTPCLGGERMWKDSWLVPASSQFLTHR